MTLAPHHLLAAWDYMLPSGDSNLAPDVDQAWKLILFVTGFFFCVVVGAMTFFVIRYRRRTPNDVTSTVTHNTPLEIIWTGVPLVLVVAFFYVGFKGFIKYDTPRSDCVNVGVIAQKWHFTFTYPNGAEDSNLYLLVNQPVRLNLTSIDVLHAIYLPNFRTQRNLVPGRQTFLWFVPTEVRTEKEDGWPIFCTQYCGDGHSRMFARVYVLDKVAYDEKMKELANPFKRKLPSGKSVFVPYAAAAPEASDSDQKEWGLGHKLYQQLGCSACHTIDGADGTGPTWKGLWKRDHEFSFRAPNALGGANFTLKSTDSDDAWYAYIKESVVDPGAKLVTFNGKAYNGSMPSFASSLSDSPLNDEKRRAIITFMKSLGTTGWKPDITPEKNPELFDADNSPLKDDQGVPVHPESEQGIALRKKLGLP